MVNSEWVTSKIMGLISGLKTHTHDASKITSGTIDAARLPELSASDIKSGVFDVARIPPVALERLVVVADDTARYALTTDTVQLGDTVKVTATGYMYMVVDDANLDSDAGYAIYTAGGIDAGQIISGVIDEARLPTAGATLFLERDCSLSLTLPEGGFLVKAFPALSVSSSTPGNISLSANIPAFPSRVSDGGDIYEYIVPSLPAASHEMTLNLSVCGQQSRGAMHASVSAGYINTYDADDNLLSACEVAALSVDSIFNAGTWSSVSAVYDVSLVGVTRVEYVSTLTNTGNDGNPPGNGANISISMPEFSVYGVRVPAVL